MFLWLGRGSRHYVETLPAEAQSSVPRWVSGTRPKMPGCGPLDSPVVRRPVLPAGRGAARGPLGTGGHFSMDCTRVQQRARRGTVPLRSASGRSASGRPAARRPRLPSRHACPRGTRREYPEARRSLFSGGAGCGHPASLPGLGRGNLVSPPLGRVSGGWSVFP